MGRRARNKQPPPAPLDAPTKPARANGKNKKKGPEIKRKRQQDEQIAQPKKQKINTKKALKKQQPESSDEEAEFLSEVAKEGGEDDLWDNVEPATDDDEPLDDEFDMDDLGSDNGDIFPKADKGFLGSDSEEEEEEQEEEESEEESDEEDEDIAEVKTRYKYTCNNGLRWNLYQFEGLDERKSRKIEARKAREAAEAEAELMDAAMQTNIAGDTEETSHFVLPEDEEEAVADVTVVNQRIQEIVNILNNFKTLRDPNV